MHASRYSAPSVLMLYGVFNLYGRLVTCLESVWADAPFHQLKASARHSTDKDALRYSRDASTLKSIAEVNGTFLNSHWKCPFVQYRQAVLSKNT